MRVAGVTVTWPLKVTELGANLEADADFKSRRRGLTVCLRRCRASRPAERGQAKDVWPQGPGEPWSGGRGCAAGSSRPRAVPCHTPSHETEGELGGGLAHMAATPNTTEPALTSFS